MAKWEVRGGATCVFSAVGCGGTHGRRAVLAERKQKRETGGSLIRAVETGTQIYWVLWVVLGPQLTKVV